MKTFYNIYRKVCKENLKIYNFKSTPVISLLLSKISYFFSPLFIILKIDPNIITFLNFILSIILIALIFFGSNDFISIAIIIYFICIIMDFCDGCVARYFNITSFYGRFIDGLVDIFQKTFLILSLSFYGFRIFADLNLLILGCTAALFASFDTFILDKYSALVRWCNLEMGRKIAPYIYKKINRRWTFFYDDIFIFFIGLIYFTNKNEEIFYYNLVFLFGLTIIAAIKNLIIHTLFSFKNLKLNKNKKKRKY